MAQVRELKGAYLDYWVARAKGMTHDQASYVIAEMSYSTKWEQGGPIIDRELIAIVPTVQDGKFTWRAAHQNAPSGIGGETALIAAMRAFVSSAFGDEVTD